MITGKRAQLLSETKVLTEYGDILRLVLLTCFPVWPLSATHKTRSFSDFGRAFGGKVPGAAGSSQQE